MIYKYIANISRISTFYIHKFFQTPFAYFGVIFLPLLFAIGICSIIPVWVAFVSSVGTSILFLELIAFGTTYFVINSSTINNNNNLTKISKNVQNISIFFFMFTIGLITLVYSMLIIFAFEHFTNLLMDRWFFWPSSPFINSGQTTEKVILRWSDLEFGALIYYVFLYTVILFSISILVTSMTDSSKTYFLFFFAVILIVLVFGGIISSSFGSNNPETGEVELGIIASPWREYVLTPSNGSWLFFVSCLVPFYWINQWAFTLFGNIAYYQINISETYAGGVITIPAGTILNLSNGTNVFSFVVHSEITFDVNSGNQFLTPDFLAGKTIELKFITSLTDNLNRWLWTESLQYNLSLVLPWLYSVFYFLLADVINHQKFKNS